MNVTFNRKAMHAPLNMNPQSLATSALEQPEARTDRHSAGWRAVVVVFLAGALAGSSVTAVCYQNQIALEHGWILKGGLLHRDVVGNLYWDSRVNGARGTTGLAGYQ